MSNERLHDVAENAVSALLPLLPLNGSWTSGYAASADIQSVVVATPQEWADAAFAVAELHAVLMDFAAAARRSGAATQRILDVLPVEPQCGLRGSMKVSDAAGVGWQQASNILRELVKAGIVKGEGGWFSRKRHNGGLT